MTCHNCQNRSNKHGKDRNGVQRYRCLPCRRVFLDPNHERPFGPMRIGQDKAVLALNLLVEGNSIRSTERLTGLHRDTIMDLLVLSGERCERLMNERIRNVPVSAVQADEIWTFVKKKEKRRSYSERFNMKIGDAYTFVGIDADTKLVLCFELGRRDTSSTVRFMSKLDRATAGRFQLTTDGFTPYVGAVEDQFGADIDFSQLVKVYSSDKTTRERYSPGHVVGTFDRKITGDPEIERISTSFVERQNLTMRTFIRRMTRLCLAFSKKWENLKAALALHFAYYNFCRVHRSLKVTPAMEAGIADHVWTIEELISTH